MSDRNGIDNIYRMDLATGEFRPITNSISGVYQLSLAREGSKLAFSSLVNGGYDLFLLRNPLDRDIKMEELERTEFYERREAGPLLAAAPAPDTTGGRPRTDTSGVYGGNVAIDFSNYVFSDPGQENIPPDSMIARLPAITQNVDSNGNYRVNRYKLNIIIATLASLLLPALARAKQRCKQVNEVNAGRQLMLAWQLYADDISAPFRETNHEPEFFVTHKNDWEIFGWKNSLLTAGFVHQSNGRGGDLSRSWNRIYASALFENGNWALAIKPWYRLPEDEKSSPTDTDGDDNPDIYKYMGYGEIRLVYHDNGHVVTLMERNNLTSDSKGAVELDYSFPLYGKMNNPRTKKTSRTPVNA